MKKISEDFFKGSQSIEYKGIYEHNGNKLKVTIDIDSYKSQSSARVHIFNQDEKKWNFLEGIHYSLMKSAGSHVYGPISDNIKSLMIKDIKILLNKSKDILD